MEGLQKRRLSSSGSCYSEIVARIGNALHSTANLQIELRIHIQNHKDIEDIEERRKAVNCKISVKVHKMEKVVMVPGGTENRPSYSRCI